MVEFSLRINGAENGDYTKADGRGWDDRLLHKSSNYNKKWSLKRDVRKEHTNVQMENGCLTGNAVKPNGRTKQ